MSTEFDKLLDSILKLASIQAFPSAFVFVISGTHSWCILYIILTMYCDYFSIGNQEKVSVGCIGFVGSDSEAWGLLTYRAALENYHPA